MNWLFERIRSLHNNHLFPPNRALRWTKWNTCEVTHGEVLGMEILTRHNCLTLRSALFINGFEQPFHRYVSYFQETLKFEVADDRIRIDVQYLPIFRTSLSVNNGVSEKRSFARQTKRMLILVVLAMLIVVGLILSI